MPIRLYRVLRCSDLEERKPVRVRTPDVDAVCVLSEGVIYAFKNSCPHTGYRLHESKVRSHLVTCLSHLAQFDLRDGSLVSPPMEGKDIPCGDLEVYQVTIEDGYVTIEVPDADQGEGGATA